MEKQTVIIGFDSSEGIYYILGNNGFLNKIKILLTGTKTSMGMVWSYEKAPTPCHSFQNRHPSLTLWNLWILTFFFFFCKKGLGRSDEVLNFEVGCTLNANTYVLIRERQRGISHTREMRRQQRQVRKQWPWRWVWGGHKRRKGTHVPHSA